MNDPRSSASTADDDVLGPVIESFLERFRRGERPALTEMIARYPEMASQIRELIPALVELEQLGAATGSFGGGGEARTPVTTWSGGGERLPDRLGDYRILREVGGGGMGMVYQAEHESLKNRVALKVMHSRFRGDRKYLQRFHVEARLAAGLHHTNIVGVFDYGEQDGVCYYAMQFIEGQPLDRVLADIRRLRQERVQPGRPIDSAAPSLSDFANAATVPLTIATDVESSVSPDPETVFLGSTADRDRPAAPELSDRGVVESPAAAGSTSFGDSAVGGYYRAIARVCAQVADALEYAHRRGVLHRDIKPANLMLDALGNIWVTDFGLAKLEEGNDLSQSRELVGTLRYMSPERFLGKSERRGDIYALGATLYELLTLRPAFEAVEHLQLIRSIQEDSPPPPRQVDRNVPRDLETIVQKAMAKDPKDRFASAGELAEELRRFVEGRPIRSRPVSFFESFWRWCKRDPWLAGANVAAAVLTTVLAVGSTIAAYVYRGQSNELRVERGKAEKASIDARKQAIEAYTAQAAAGRFSHRPGQRFESLKAVADASKLLDGLPSGTDLHSKRETLRDLAVAAMSLPDIRLSRTFGTISSKTSGSDIDPTFERCAVGERTGECVGYRVADGAEVFRIPPVRSRVETVLQFGPDGRSLVILDSTDTLRLFRVDGARPELIARISTSDWSRDSASFRPDGSALVCLLSDQTLGLIDVKTGTQRRLASDRRAINKVSFHPDGDRLAVATKRGGKNSVEIRRVDDPTPIASISLTATVSSMAFSPDGRRLAIATGNSEAQVWDFDRTNSKPVELAGLNSGGIMIAFNHRGDMLASHGWEGVLRLWDPITGRQLLSFQGISLMPRFSKDDRFIGLGIGEKSMEIYEVAPGRELRTLPGEPGPNGSPQGLAIAPNGRLLTIRKSGSLDFWDTSRRERLADVERLGWASNLFEKDGSLVTFNEDGILRWPSHASGSDLRIGPPRFVSHMGHKGGNLAVSQDAKIVVGTYQSTGALAFHADHGEQFIQLGPQNDVRGVAISPDGKWALTASHNNASPHLVLWEVAKGLRIDALKIPSATTFRFSPDGRWLATSTASTFRIWEVGTWRLEREFPGEQGWFDFSPDSSIIAVCSRSKVILHEAATGRRLAALESSEQNHPTHLVFSADGTVLAANDGESHGVHLWDLGMIRAGLARLGLDWQDSSKSSASVSTLAGPSPIAPPPPLHFELVGGTQADFARAEIANILQGVGTQLRRLVTRRLESSQEYLIRSNQWLMLGAWKAAREDLKIVSRRNPDNPFLYATIGECSYQGGDDLAAIAAYERAITLAPDHLNTTNSLAWALLMTTPARREPARALSLARKVHAANPKDGNTNNTLALALSRLGRDAEAVAAVSQSARPSIWDDLVLAPSYHRLGQTDRARKALTRVIATSTEGPGLNGRELTDFRTLVNEAETALAVPPPSK